MPHRSPLSAGDPRWLGDYMLIGRLGEGGQAVVYLGRSRDGDLVAVRLLRGGWTAAASTRTRFIKQAATGLRVDSSHVARLRDVDVKGNRPYVVSEFVDGPSLQRMVDERGLLLGDRLERLALSTAAALAAIHAAGIVHRDFKPGNIVLGRAGPKVINCEIAQALDSVTPATSHPAGTPAYMAPEQVEGEPVGPAADVFAWGSTMVFAATGRPPFGIRPHAAVTRRIAERAPRLGPLTGTLRELVTACLHKDPPARPSAEELVRALRDGDPYVPGDDGPDIVAPRLRVVLLVLVVMAVGFVMGLMAPWQS